MRRVPVDLRAAFRRYYANRKVQATKRWDKRADLENIFSVLKRTRGYRCVQACAGTFWITWKDGVQTSHEQRNYWTPKIIWRKP